MPATADVLIGLIRREIEAAAPISCARFMELALYHPVHGYYEQPLKQIGCQGDFFTSVSVGSLFGGLLGFRFAGWLERLGQFQLRPGGSAEAVLIEAGAHDGRLAHDILSWFQKRRPDLFARLQYSILEPSQARRQAQSLLLRDFQPVVRWLDDWWAFPSRQVSGIIFSNELLDAFPVFRLCWNGAGRRWQEWRVCWTGARLGWARSDELSPAVAAELSNEPWATLPADLLQALPDGFTIELSPAARSWWAAAAGALDQGFLLTFDYGGEWQDVLAPHRPQGTFRSYRAQHLTDDPLDCPGRQDLTADVNFSVLKETGLAAGLQTDCFCSQSVFLTRILADIHRDPSRFGAWGRSHTRQFQTLTHPEHLGRAFRVLVQTRLPAGAAEDAAG